MISILLALLLQAPPPFTGEPPPPPPPPPTSPCTMNPAESCTFINMNINGSNRMFTETDLGRPVNSIDESTVCYGRLSRGVFRYYVNGTAPSSLVGTLVPSPIPLEGDMPNDPSGTLQEGNVIQLFNREQIMNFKATQANWDGADLTWECQL